MRPIVNRNIVVALILSVVTCGIYGIYWMYCLGEDIKAISNDQTAPSGGMLIVLTLVTCGIYLMFWNYKAGERLEAAGKARGIPIPNNGVLYLIIGLFAGFIVNCIIQSEVNKFATPAQG